MDANGMGAPIATGRQAPIRILTSWKMSDRRSVRLMWPCNLEQAAVLPADPDRHDRRFRPLDELGYARLPASVDRWPEAKLSGAVEIAPDGKTTTSPPFAR
jgi:hypothetical protein